MKLLVKAVQAVYSVYAMLVFTLLMVLLLPFIVLSTMLPKPAAGNILYRILIFWSDVGMFLWGMRQHTINAEQHSPGHPVIFVFNHISYVDIPVLLKALRRFHFRILGKMEMSKVPVFGFIYRSAVVMVDRSSAGNRAKSVAKLKETLKTNISIVIAPEGTFNETGRPLKEFYDGAFRIALETQTPVVPIVFPDNYQRLHPSGIFTFTPGRARAIFLPEIDVSEFDASDISGLKEHVYRIMELALIESKAGWIRTNNE